MCFIYHHISVSLINAIRYKLLVIIVNYLLYFPHQHIMFSALVHILNEKVVINIYEIYFKVVCIIQ